MTTNGTYGATNNTQQQEQQHSQTNNTGTIRATEEDALLPKKQIKSKNWRKFLNTNVSRDKADLVLLFSYITTGLLDSTATAVWGSFVSMQTGNTVYVGLGLSNPTASTRWIKSGTSILSFCFGSFLFARYHRRFHARRRWVLIVAVFIQLLCIIAAALIVTIMPKTSPGDGNDVKWHVLLPLALVAFQSSGQAVISRALQYGALTSVVLTSIYCDLFSDAKLFADLTGNVERNRRAAAPLLLLLGAVLGGLWSKTEVGMTGALWTAALFKLIVMVTWIFWPDDKDSED